MSQPAHPLIKGPLGTASERRAAHPEHQRGRKGAHTLRAAQERKDPSETCSQAVDLSAKSLKGPVVPGRRRQDADAEARNTHGAQSIAPPPCSSPFLRAPAEPQCKPQGRAPLRAVLPVARAFFPYPRSSRSYFRRYLWRRGAETSADACHVGVLVIRWGSPRIEGSSGAVLRLLGSTGLSFSCHGLRHACLGAVRHGTGIREHLQSSGGSHRS